MKQLFRLFSLSRGVRAAGIMCSYAAAAGAQAAPRGYLQHALAGASPGLRVEILEDARITPALRPLIEAAYGEAPCAADNSQRPPELCAELAQRPLEPAIVRLIDSRNRELGRLPLERATAEVLRVPVSRADSLLGVQVDLSAGIGSYSGPLVRFVNTRGGRLAWMSIVNDVTGRSSDLSLPTTLKTAWRANLDAPHPELLLVACRPDLETMDAGGEARFVVTYSRLDLRDDGWHRTDRRAPGCWENEGAFPPRSLFP
ncbi:MAG: hypothetical protein ABJF01_24185 [bacterium]